VVVASSIILIVLVTVVTWLKVNGRRELRGRDDTAPGIVDVGPALFSQPKVSSVLLYVG